MRSGQAVRDGFCLSDVYGGRCVPGGAYKGAGTRSGKINPWSGVVKALHYCEPERSPHLYRKPTLISSF